MRETVLMPALAASVAVVCGIIGISWIAHSLEMFALGAACGGIYGAIVMHRIHRRKIRQLQGVVGSMLRERAGISQRAPSHTPSTQQLTVIDRIASLIEED